MNERNDTVPAPTGSSPSPYFSITAPYSADVGVGGSSPIGPSTLKKAPSVFSAPTWSMIDGAAQAPTKKMVGLDAERRPRRRSPPCTRRRPRGRTCASGSVAAAALSAELMSVAMIG